MLVAAYAARAAFRANAHQAQQIAILKDESTDRQQDRRRSQALGVSAWIANRVDGLWALNASSGPIYDVQITYVTPGDSSKLTWERHVLPPGSAKAHPNPAEHLSDLAASVERAFDEAKQGELAEYRERFRLLKEERAEFERTSEAEQAIWRRAEEIEKMWLNCGLTIEFRDSAGVRWKRDARGVLSEMS
ncbi:hypothetical protein [Actinocrispum wychmicini]|uniref:hypothetical protein n=1 Tax=Actinocrispum wychmicini TaxID=1213861 RepID=UPI001046C118|nr:hypothetical protein [Actinocrispum wychmicini]